MHAPSQPPASPPPPVPEPEDTTEDGAQAAGAGLLATLHRYRRVIGFIFAVWIAVVLAGGILISALDARTGLHVFGPRQWVAGEPGVLRVGLRDLEFTRYEAIAAVEARFLPRPAGEVADWPPLTPEEQASTAQQLDQHAGDFVQGTVVPPTPGTWRVNLTALSERGPITVDLLVDVLPANTPPAPPRAQRHEAPPLFDRGPLKIDLFPTDHALPGDLPTELTVRVTEADGTPRSVPVSLHLREGRSATTLPARVHTDHFGLARVHFKAQAPRIWVDIEAPAPPETPEIIDAPGASTDGGVPEVPWSIPADPPAAPGSVPGSEAPAVVAHVPAAPPSAPPDPWHTRAARRIKRTPTQHMITVPDEPLRPGATVPVAVALLHRKAERIFVDAWVGDRWVATTTLAVEAGAGEGSITLPEHLPDPALVWIQAYGGAYLPQQARGGRYVVVGTADPLELVRFAARTYAAAGIEPGWSNAVANDPQLDVQVLRPLLGRADRPDGDPPLLANSTDSVRQTVATLKRTWQRRLVMALLGTGVAMFGLLGWVVRQNGRQVRAGWAAAGGDDEGVAGTRTGMLREALPIFVILALFLSGLVLVLHQIRW